MVESEVLGWTGVNKETVRGGPGQGGFGFRHSPSTSSTIGRSGTCTMTAWQTSRSREIHDEVISDGRAKPRGAGLASVVSYHIRELEDVPECVERFRMNYERASAFAERRRKA